jgi:hypothetical protein
MKYFAKIEALQSMYFEIKEDPAAGFYLYVFEGEKCIYDHLQDTFEIAVECALEDYRVPKNAWEKIENEASN